MFTIDLIEPLPYFLVILKNTFVSVSPSCEFCKSHKQWETFPRWLFFKGFFHSANTDFLWHDLITNSFYKYKNKFKYKYKYKRWLEIHLGAFGHCTRRDLRHAGQTIKTNRTKNKESNVANTSLDRKTLLGREAYCLTYWPSVLKILLHWNVEHLGNVSKLNYIWNLMEAKQKCTILSNRSEVWYVKKKNNLMISKLDWCLTVRGNYLQTKFGMELVVNDSSRDI